MALISIHKTAKDICAIIGDRNYSKEMMITRHLTNGYRDLSLHVIPDKEDFTVETTAYKVGDNLSVTLPKDFVYYTKVGRCVNGEMEEFGYNEDLCNSIDTNTENCGCVDADPENCINPAEASPYFYNISWFNGYSERYGVRGGYNSRFYKYDKTNQRMLFGGSVGTGDTVLIEYKKDIGKGTNVIPPECEEALKEYALKTLALNPAHKLNPDRHQKLYEVQHARLKQLYETLTQREYYDAMMRNVYSGPKR